MSSILAIETSTPTGSVAVVCDDEIRFEKCFTSERSHNSQLFAPLREALEICGPSLRAVVVGLGPASYTGVRIGIAAAQGLALSRNVPVIGLPSVMALKTHVIQKEPIEAGQPVWPRRSNSYYFCGDARRGHFFIAEVRGGSMGGLETLDAEGLRQRHAENEQKCPWFTFDPTPPLGLASVYQVRPSAAVLAEAVTTWTDEELNYVAGRPLEPIYLAAPFITMPKKAGNAATSKAAPDILPRQ
jgi:tRNA threonylcarbamoyl adenosine modification protein YeaZ